MMGPHNQRDEPRLFEPAPSVPDGSGPRPQAGDDRVSFQAAAGRQGRQFADQCNAALTDLGFELLGSRRFDEVGVEVDQVAVSPRGNEIWLEYKGSVRGRTPGLLRTDTTKKAIANGALLKTLDDPQPFVLLTSHLPTGGSSLAMLETAIEHRIVDLAVSIYEPDWESRLEAY